VPPTRVIFYTGAGADFVGVPPCLTLGELFFITNQDRSGKVYFSLADDPIVPEVPPSPLPPIELPTSPPSPSHMPVFHSGLSLLSNSFGMILPTLDSRGFESRQEEEGTPETAIDMRNQLEAMLSGNLFE
jgi:hypothetical protein